ncbi:MAG: CHAT domain-containing protein [Proteobacteria bacterium]|nr:CHAT domain-containing protein [Pseudomonadota bacterium]
MATRASNITFIVPGQPRSPQAERGQVTASVQVGATQRGAGDPVRLTARPGEDIVVLTIAGGPTLYLSPENARDLLRSQDAGATRSAAPGGGSDDVVVSPQLGWPGLEAGATRGATRGWLGQTVLSAIDVVSDLTHDPADALAAAAVTRKVDGQVDEGVYALSADPLPANLKEGGKRLDQVAAATDGGPLLVLVHGTFVDTVSTFGKLWTQHPQAVRDLFAAYQGRVLALDHATMGKSPIANALTLVKGLPAGARLHLVTHSRGGLVAEILARACGAPLSPDDLALFGGAAYAQHRSDLQALVKTAQTKGLKVEKVVRVACPARGTLLASRRFDAYLSVLQWALTLAGVPVLGALVDFLHEVARRRADPAELPGIEAMMPESPVVAWLNRGDQTIPGELRVIAGDMEGDSVVSWVKTLLTDAFYWTDNDIVVQTRSMYGGAPRAATADGAGASFFLDAGSNVSHFNYFSNDKTVNAIVGALTTDAAPDFAAIGPLSWSGKDASGTRAALAAVARSSSAGAADKPAVFMLPGILGSNLKLDGERIWLAFRFINGLAKLAWDPATASRVEPDGPIGSVYDDLMTRLADTHEVIPFAFDWRRPIEDEACRLADAVDAALAARNASQQPVRLIAHSMGGLVARTMRLERPETWQRMMARDGARLLMLGTPNAGSWAPMQTLSGDDTFGNALVAFGSLFHNGATRKLMAAMPGFVQLQAGLLDPALGLGQAATWQKLADDDIAALRAKSLWHDEGTQQAVYEWGAPPQGVLDQAVALRGRLDAQVPTLGADAAKMLLVVGHAPFTPNGYVMGNDGLEYTNVPDDGDGRVPLQSALLPGVRTWKVDAEHGKLPSVGSAFAGYVELLTTGQTSQLEVYQPAEPAPSRSALMPATADATALVRSRPSHGLHGSLPPSSGADVLGADPDSGGAAGAAAGAGVRGRTAALAVSVYNGDLKFVRQPLLVGHYRSALLTGSEAVVDGLVGKGMSRALQAGLYPDAIGTHQVFGNQRPNPENPLQMARPLAAVIVGLGEEGKLREAELSYTVRQAVLAYAQRLYEQDGAGAAQFEIAATLMGSGGQGISADASARAIAQGVLDANQRIAANDWPQVGGLVLVELYLDRAGEAWRALQMLQAAAPQKLRLTGRMTFGPGALRRSLDSGYRGTAYDFISALQAPGSNDADNPLIAYALDTKRARTEVRAQGTQGTLLRQLVAKASNDANTDRRIGRTLFNLLVPVEVEPFLAGSSEMVLEVEPATAGIPWELLDTHPDEHAADQRPWAIRSRLVRKLRLEDFRTRVSDATADDDVLVIGEPECDPAIYPPLVGARNEALAVIQQLTAPGIGLAADKVSKLVDNNDAQSIIDALFEKRYRVVHIAGHGEPGPQGGVVLSGKQTYLGANEVEAMRIVPELVFLNCCHLAARDVAATLAPRPPYDRATFAANIAEALIRIGVRCVIAAGWAVEDEPAKQFATAFYASLLSGARFIEAVGAARSAAWRANRSGNTWAAYQCYGDPEWTWQRAGVDPQRPAPPIGNEFAAIASPVSLALALETIATRSNFSRSPGDRPLDKLRYLEGEFKSQWGGIGAIAEAFGVAYAAAGADDDAIDWLERAADAEDASASMKAAEQLGNLLARRGERNNDVAGIRRGIAQLATLADTRPTVERASLLGSAYKRLTMVEWRAGHEAAAAAALAEAARRYTAAAEMALKIGSPDYFYPAKNGISCEVRAALLGKRKLEIDPDRWKAVNDSIHKAAAEVPDFWSVVGQTELLALQALAQARLAAALPGIKAGFADLYARMPAKSKWDSVSNEAMFTLQPYEALAASPAERRAARELLATLAQHASAAARQ